jgi:transposase InsO family protein
LSLKLGIHIAPRTVRRYLDSRKPPDCSGQRWSTFIRNHAQAIVACDFCVSVTAKFQILYLFVAMGIGSRRIPHFNVTAHPTAEWTIQQFREILADPHPYRFVVHDRDSIFSSALDGALRDFGVRPIRTAVRAPKANAYCERLIGTMQFLFRRIAWRLQANAEGVLSERARRRATEIADDRDLRIRAPEEFVTRPDSGSGSVDRTGSVILLVAPSAHRGCSDKIAKLVGF